MLLGRVTARVAGRRGNLCALGVPLARLTLAHGSPAELTWSSGVHDESDPDEVVIPVVSATGLAETSAHCAKPADVSAEMVLPPLPIVAVGSFSSTLSIRAPPPAGFLANRQCARVRAEQLQRQLLLSPPTCGRGRWS